MKAVRDTYYTGFGGEVDGIFAGGGWRWHADAGAWALRLLLPGLFDRLPGLQAILVHWGEVIMPCLDRIGPALGRGIKGKLGRTIEDYVKGSFYATPRGIMSQRCLRNAVEVMGIDRVTFPVDYPHLCVPNASKFLTGAVLSGKEKAGIAHGNWERLTAR